MKKWKVWLKAAGVRAIRTMAQTALGVIGASAPMGSVSWPTVISAAALSGLVSMLTSLAGLPEVKGAK